MTKSIKKSRTAVIGAGIGGLAVAIRLARRGYDVVVFEQSGRPGGKIGEWRSGGFRFDTGPSLFTLPQLISELLDTDLQLTVKRLPVLSRNFFNDGTLIEAPSDPVQFSMAMGASTNTRPSAISAYLAHAASLFDLIAPAFLFRSLHDMASLLKVENLRYLWQWPRLRAFITLHAYNQRTLNHPKLVQMMDRYATYNGSNPYQTPATMAVIAHLENNLGVWFPEGGMYTMVTALMKQAARLGVTFRFDTRVEKIRFDDRKIVGLEVSDAVDFFDRVVSDVDVHQLYSHLLPDPGVLKRIETTDRSTSALIFYMGIKGIFPKLDVHNVFFSNDYEGEFRSLFEKKTIHPDPTVYVYISAKVDATDAPAGCENWFVMINAPENIGQDWDALRKQARKSILQKLSLNLSVDVESCIMLEQWLDPVMIEKETGSWRGSLYGAASNSRFSAFSRHANFNSKYPGLYFTGGSVHPGGGIPLCLASAKIVESLIEKEKG